MKILQIIPAREGIDARFGKNTDVRVECWALIEQDGVQRVVGMVTIQDAAALMPADAQSTFTGYYETNASYQNIPLHTPHIARVSDFNTAKALFGDLHL